jgi:hypothetical protein
LYDLRLREVGRHLLSSPACLGFLIGHKHGARPARLCFRRADVSCLYVFELVRLDWCIDTARFSGATYLERRVWPDPS